MTMKSCMMRMMDRLSTVLFCLLSAFSWVVLAYVVHEVWVGNTIDLPRWVGLGIGAALGYTAVNPLWYVLFYQWHEHRANERGEEWQ